MQLYSAHFGLSPKNFFLKKILTFFPDRNRSGKFLIISQKKAFLLFLEIKLCTFQSKLKKLKKFTLRKFLKRKLFLYFRRLKPRENFLYFLKRKLFLHFRKRKPRKKNFIFQETELSYISTWKLFHLKQGEPLFVSEEFGLEP